MRTCQRANMRGASAFQLCWRHRISGHLHLQRTMRYRDCERARAPYFRQVGPSALPLHVLRKTKR